MGVDLSKLSTEDLLNLQAGNLSKVSTQGLLALQGPPKMQKIETIDESLRGVLKEADPFTRNLASAGTALSNLWQGAKQMVGKGDAAAIQANRVIASEAPVGAFVGNAALLAPTAMLPGANTVAGAGTIGALTSLFQPTQGDESRPLNTATGAAFGAAGQKIGNVIGERLTQRAANKAAELAAQKSQNSVRDATFAAGQEAGYVVPPSAVNSTWLGRRLESIGGKAAIGQEAAGRNQATTNILARRAVGMADDAPITESALEVRRNVLAQPYRDVSALPTLPPDRTTGIRGYPLIGPDKQPPAEALRDLKLARSQAKDAWKEYDRTGVVTAKEAAEAMTDKVAKLENYLEETAVAANRPELVEALRGARRDIAKTFDVERALNLGTGDVSAPVLGRALDRGAPMTGELGTIAKFQQAFPQYMREGERIPTPGVSKSEALAMALLGMGGVGASDDWKGSVLGVLPLLSSPARAAVLSQMVQKNLPPSYTVGAATRALGQVTPERAGLLARALLQPTAPAAMLQQFALQPTVGQ